MPETVPDGSIVITPKEFYDGVRSDVDEIKTAIAALTTSVSPLPTRVDKLELQVDDLKRRLWWAAGFTAGVGAAAGSVLTRLLA